MELVNKEDIQSAIDCFLSCEEYIHNIFQSEDVSKTPPELNFSHISTFSSNVLFISPSPSATLEKLNEVTDYMTQEFIKEGLITTAKMSKKSWNPHCTIAKTSADRKNGR